jgi:hypothetical protein
MAIHHLTDTPAEKSQILVNNHSQASWFVMQPRINDGDLGQPLPVYGRAKVDHNSMIVLYLHPGQARNIF